MIESNSNTQSIIVVCYWYGCIQRYVSLKISSENQFCLTCCKNFHLEMLRNCFSRSSLRCLLVFAGKKVDWLKMLEISSNNRHPSWNNHFLDPKWQDSWSFSSKFFWQISFLDKSKPLNRTSSWVNRVIISNRRRKWPSGSPICTLVLLKNALVDAIRIISVVHSITILSQTGVDYSK